MAKPITIYERHFSHWEFEPGDYQTLADVRAWVKSEIAGLKDAIATATEPRHKDGWQEDLDQVLQAQAGLEEVIANYGPKARLRDAAREG